MTMAREPSPAQFDDLMALVSRVAVNATVMDSDFLQVFRDMGIARRSVPRNRYLGLTITRPDERCAVFGLSYIDVKDQAPANEDPFLFEFDPPRLTQLKPADLTKRFPEYGSFHHAPKFQFLPDVP